MFGAVHLVIEDRVEDGALIELQLMQAQRQVAVAVALVEHHLLGVNRPPFREDARVKNLSHERWAAVPILELDVVTRVGLVDREDLEHCGVVFAQESLDARRCPVPGRRRDGVEAIGFRVEGRRGVQVRGREAALELGHLDHLAGVGIGQGEDLLVPDERLDLRHRLPGIGDDVLGLAMLLAEFAEHASDGGPAPLGIVGRHRLTGEDLRPELFGHVPHLALDAVGLGLGESHDLIGREAGVEFQFQLPGELLLPEPPLALRPGQEFGFEPVLIILECLHGLLARRCERFTAGGFFRELENVLLVEVDCTEVALDGDLGEDPWRVLESLLRRRDDSWNVCDAPRGVLDVALTRQCRLREENEDAVGDELSIDARVELEAVVVFDRPESIPQIVRPDFVIDLAVSRQLLEVDLLPKLGEDGAGIRDIFLPRGGRKVVEPVIVLVVPLLRGEDRMTLEFLIEEALEEVRKANVLGRRSWPQCAAGTAMVEAPSETRSANRTRDIGNASLV